MSVTDLQGTSQEQGGMLLFIFWLSMDVPLAERASTHAGPVSGPALIVHS
jgi:hypothetical protein